MRNVFAATALGVLAAACGGSDSMSTTSGQSGAPGAMEVEALWPQPLPDHWILGSVTGVAVDSQDHVWVVHRGQASLNPRTESSLTSDPPGAETCCLAAPAVLEFDAAGALVSSWGGPGDGYDWPQSPGGIDVDADGNVWIAAAGAPAAGGRGGRGGRGGGADPPPVDAHVLKFSRAGEFLMQIGAPGDTGDGTMGGLNRPADIAVDSTAGEVYVADTGNRRVVVFDAATGDYKRHWGAYGETADAAASLGNYAPGGEPARQFRLLSCVELGPDGAVYVCDRTANRIQVFEKDGTFVREAVVSPATLEAGAAWDVVVTAETVYVADGQDHHVITLDASALTASGTLGAGGRWPGHFHSVGSIAVDSAGNLYTGEALEGKRVQKFTRRQQ